MSFGFHLVPLQVATHPHIRTVPHLFPEPGVTVEPGLQRLSFGSGIRLASEVHQVRVFFALRPALGV